MPNPGATPKARSRGFRESHSCKLSTGKEVILRIDATFGRARGYPNGLRWIMFDHEILGRGIDLRGPVSQEEWPEFLAFLERILADLSERLGVSFVAEREYQRNLGLYTVEFHPRILPTEPIVIFKKHGDD